MISLSDEALKHRRGEQGIKCFVLVRLREKSKTFRQVNTLKPRRLKKGDLIALVSPASAPSSMEKIEGSVRYLEGLGYRVEVGKNAGNIHGYLAGSDVERAADLNAFIRDRRVRAIFAVRGGYGVQRILDRIDYLSLRADPKIISGFSDITGLQLALFKKCRLVTVSGPMPGVEFWKNPDPYTEESFWRIITSPRKIGVLKNPESSQLQSIKSGNAEGTLLGGNLSLVVSNLATPYWPSPRKSILVIEEVDEAPYRVDRMFAQLKNSKTLKQVRALICGKFTKCDRATSAKPDLTIDQIMRDYAQIVSGPVLSNLQYGHVPIKLTIPFGLIARVDSAKLRLEVLENAVT